MSGAAGMSAERLRQVWAAARLDLLRLSRGRYRHARTFLVGLPALVSIIAALVVIKVAERAFTEVLVVGSGSQTPAQSLSMAAMTMWPLSIRFCLFLAAIDVFGGLFRAELSERTLHHVFLQPLRRETVTVGKYLGGLLLLARLGALAWLLVMLAWLLPHGPGAMISTMFSGIGFKILFSYLLAMVLGLAAYGGLFLVAGMIARGPVLVGAGLWIWEGLAGYLPVSFQRFTVSYWLNSLRPVRSLGEDTGLMAIFRQEAEPAPLLACVVVCLLIGAVATALAAWWSRHLELAYGAKD